MREHRKTANIVLTVVVGLLAWLAVAKLQYRSANAQVAARQYTVEVVTANYGSHTFQADLAAAINDAAKGRELVTVIKHDVPGKYLAIYK